ncbi:DUF3883 domain-containing protein [Paraburkholderia fungorum]|jgi:hypothetical protein|uniref:DUF3883 domain-containing protein n=1 Tax=Paraburkholderia fungorum TaxID=134537 RepID=UPI00248DA4A5|nr:DUF3883 domain-containing protein [Paraburkholderia fungorum]
MAGALDLERVAATLADGDLVSVDGCISVQKQMRGLAWRADRRTLLHIARVLLETFPPSWIGNVVSKDGVAWEYIPAVDSDALEWIGEDLLDLLTDVATKRVLSRDEEFRQKLGRLGERILAECKRRQGERVIHVAEISDSFGYDLECYPSSPNILERIEVKTALTHTNETFHITRNEREKARLYGEEWKLVQIVLSAQAAWKETISSNDVVLIRSLTAAAIVELTARDTPHFRWEESAMISPPTSMWTRYPVFLNDKSEFNL